MTTTETIPFTGMDLTIPILMTYERLIAFGPRPGMEIWLNAYDSETGKLVTSSLQNLPVTGIEAENGLCIKYVVSNPDNNSGKIILR